jgi:hypothetical protein
VWSKVGACRERFKPTRMVIPCLLVLLGQLGCHSASDDPSATPDRPLDKGNGAASRLVRPLNQEGDPPPTSVQILHKGRTSTLSFCVAGSTGKIYGLPGIPGEREIQAGFGLEWTFGGDRRK